MQPVVHTAPGHPTPGESRPLPPRESNPPMTAHHQFLPPDRATQILLQQFL